MSGKSGEAPHAITTQIGKRGVLVIPAAFRRWLGMDETAPVRVEVRDGGLLIRRLRDEITPEEREAFLEAVGVAYDELRKDPERWAAYQAEFEEWERLTSESLPPERWPEATAH